MKLEQLDIAVSLHRYIEITYEVDRYSVALLKDDGVTELCREYGQTVFDALSNFNKNYPLNCILYLPNEDI